MGLQSSGNESMDQVILGHLCHFQQPLRQQGLQASQIQVVNEWHDMLDCTVKCWSPSCHHYRATRFKIFHSSRSLQWQNTLRWKGLIFQDIRTKQVRSSSISDYKMQKIYGGKIYSSSAPLARNYTNRISSQKMAQEVWNIKLDWKSQLWFKLCADQVQSYCVTDL